VDEEEGRWTDTKKKHQRPQTTAKVEKQGQQTIKK